MRRCSECGQRIPRVVFKRDPEAKLFRAGEVRVEERKVALGDVWAPVYVTKEGLAALEKVVREAEGQAAGRGAKQAVELLQASGLRVRMKLAWGLIRRKLT